MTISPSVMVRGSYSSVGIFHSTICSVGPVYRREGGGRRRKEEGCQAVHITIIFQLLQLKCATKLKKELLKS